MPVGRSVTGLHSGSGSRRVQEVRAVAFLAGDAGWVLISVEASLLCRATADAIASAVGSAGLGATVVASTNRGAAPLCGGTEPAGYRASVVRLAASVGWLAASRASDAVVTASTGEVDFGLGSGDLEPGLPFVDVLHVAPDARRPRLVIANAALPRLVDTTRGQGELGVWRETEDALEAVLGGPAVVLGMNATPAQEPMGRAQRAGQTRRVADALVPAVLRALGSGEERVPCALDVTSASRAVATLPLPDRYAVRQAADRAEFGCQDGTRLQRFEATVRWQWLERVYQAAMNGRTGQVEVPISLVRLGPVALCGLGVELSEAAAARVAENSLAGLPWILSGAGGRLGTAALVPDPPSLDGWREAEPMTDLWPLHSGALAELSGALSELAA